MHNNAIRVIHPYKLNGSCVFDDEAVGLKQEPFVAGADDILDVLASDIKGAENGMTVRFSDTAFPGYQHGFELATEEDGGAWYYSYSLDMTGWLCPALFKYFAEAPESLYVQVLASSSSKCSSQSKPA